MKKIQDIIKKEFPFFMAVPAFIWAILFLYIPLVTIIGTSFFAGRMDGSGISLNLSYYFLFFDWLYGFIIMRSLLLALGTAVVSLIIAYPVAYYIARYANRSKNLLLFFTMLPFSINLLIHTYAWFFIIGDTGLFNMLLVNCGIIHEPIHLLYSPLAVYIGMVYCYVPFMILPLYAILEKLDTRLIEASRDLGASWYTTFTRVIIPLSMPGIKTGFFLVFIPVFGEFVIPALLGGNKQMFVGTLISYYFLTARNTELGSAFTCLSSIALLIVSLVIYRCLNRIET